MFESKMTFGRVLNGYGKIFIYSKQFMDGRFVLFSPLKNEYFWDCIDLLEAQYNG